MKRFLFFLSALIIISSGVSHARSYKIAVVPWAGWSPVHVAEAKGFWKDLGVDVRVFTLPNIQQVKELLQNKNIDIAFDKIGGSVGDYMEGTPVTIVAETNRSFGGDKIILKKGSSNESIKGKLIGVYAKDPAITFFLSQYLNSSGLFLKDIMHIEMEIADLTDNFIDDRFQAVICCDPEALRAEREGKGQVTATSASYGEGIPEGMVMHKKVFSAVPENDLVNIIKGWTLAVQWINSENNRAEYIKILKEKTFVQNGPFSEQEIMDMIAGVKIHNPTEFFNRNKENGGLHNYLNSLRDFLKANHKLDKNFKTDDIFNNHAVMKSLRISNRFIKRQ